MLQFRDECLSEITEEAQKSLQILKNDVEYYSNLLLKLSLDVFYRLMDNEVFLECSSEDLDVVGSASQKAAEIFKGSTGLDIRVTVLGTLSEI